jgi:hypothetical protein
MASFRARRHDLDVTSGHQERALEEALRVLSPVPSRWNRRPQPAVADHRWAKTRRLMNCVS